MCQQDPRCFVSIEGETIAFLECNGKHIKSPDHFWLVDPQRTFPNTSSGGMHHKHGVIAIHEQKRLLQKLRQLLLQ